MINLAATCALTLYLVAGEPTPFDKLNRMQQVVAEKAKTQCPLRYPESPCVGYIEFKANGHTNVACVKKVSKS